MSKDAGRPERARSAWPGRRSGKIIAALSQVLDSFY